MFTILPSNEVSLANKLKIKYVSFEIETRKLRTLLGNSLSSLGIPLGGVCCIFKLVSKNFRSVMSVRKRKNPERT